jgi:hypothetical protein
MTSRCYDTSFRWMLCETGKRQVAFEVIFHFENPMLLQNNIPGARYNISAMGVFVFDKEGRICS